MPRYIIKLGEHYLEWSTIVDAPVTYGMTLDDFKQYYQREYGLEGMRHLGERLARVEAKGTSAINHSDVKDTLAGNRAGEGETTLTRDQIYQAYCLRDPE